MIQRNRISSSSLRASWKEKERNKVNVGVLFSFLSKINDQSHIQLLLTNDAFGSWLHREEKRQDTHTKERRLWTCKEEEKKSIQNELVHHPKVQFKTTCDPIS